MRGARAGALVLLAVAAFEPRAGAQEQAGWQCTSDAECGTGLVCKVGVCEEPPMKRRSVGLMFGGGVMIAAGGVLLLAGGYGLQTNGDETQAIILAASGAAVAACGTVLLVIGSRRVPATSAPTAAVTPYITTSGGGVGLVLRL